MKLYRDLGSIQLTISITIIHNQRPRKGDGPVEDVAQTFRLALRHVALYSFLGFQKQTRVDAFGSLLSVTVGYFSFMSSRRLLKASTAQGLSLV